MANAFEAPNLEQFFAPVKAINELTLANVQKIVALQTQNFEKYSKLAFTSMQEVSQLKDIDQSKAYFEKQGDASKKLAADVAADVQVVVELNKTYAEEVQKLVSGNVETVVAKTKAKSAKAA